jgi:hypothetical protein
MPAPTPISATDVPDSVTVSTPAATKAGIAAAYNAAVLAQYNALPANEQAAYSPPAIAAYMRSRLVDIYQSYKVQAERAELMGERLEDKWGSLTQAQRNQIKTILATVP